MRYAVVLKVGEATNQTNFLIEQRGQPLLKNVASGFLQISLNHPIIVEAENVNIIRIQRIGLRISNISS